MPFKKTRVPKYLIMEDSNPPTTNRWVSWVILVFLLATLAAFTLI